MKFDKANHGFLYAFRLGGNRFSKNPAWSVEWGTEKCIDSMHFLGQ